MGRVLVDQPDVVAAVVVGLDDQVGNDVLGVTSAVNEAPGLGLSRRRCSSASLIVSIGIPGLLLDGRQAVVLEVVEMVGDQDLQHVVARGLGRELQEQALAQVAGADAGRVELLNEAERLLGLLQGGLAAEVADHVVQLELEDSRCRPGCK